MMDRAQLQRLRANVRAYDNRAVFEIPKILEGLIAQHRIASSKGWRNGIASQFEHEIHGGM
jgi:hypothetical protein